MNFQGQFNFGYPITSHNIITDVPDNAVLPLSIGNSLQGNILGITYGNLKSGISPSFDAGTEGFKAGTNAGTNLTVDAYYPVAVGYGALQNATAQNELIAVGSHALGSVSDNMSVGTNIAIGTYAMGNVTSDASANIAIGSYSMGNATRLGGDNIGIGFRTGDKLNNGASNILIGSYAGENIGYGKRNIGIGSGALNNVVNVDDNTAIGHNALQANTSGTWNTGVGSYALAANTTGILNTAMGFEALLVNTTGFRNTAFGTQALTSNTTGIKNVALGTESLSANITGVENTAVGDGTYNGSTGNRNTLVGFQAGANNFNECVVLGRSAAATANNQFVVGSTSYNAGAIATETITANRTWTVRINGANYKIPMVAI